MKTVLLTGATGFIGGAVLRSLHDSGFSIASLVRDSRSLSSFEQKERHLWLHIGNAKQWIASCRPSAVIHIATAYGIHEPVSEVFRTNVLLPLQLLEQSAKAGCSLFINTDTFYSKPEFAYEHLAAYIRSKKQFIETAQIFLQQHSEIQFANLRLEHVYGERDKPSKFVPSLLTNLANGVEKIAMTDGQQQRDFVHVDDVAKAFAFVAMNGTQQQCQIKEYQIGRGETMSIKQFAMLARQITGSKTKLDFGALPQRGGEIPYSVANISAIQELGWHPTITVEEGLRRVIHGGLLTTAPAELSGRSSTLGSTDT